MKGQCFAPSQLVNGREPGGGAGDALISVIQPFSAKRKVALGREVEFRFSQWCCAFVFHWMQKGQFESQGRGGGRMGWGMLGEEEQLPGAEVKGGRGLLLWSAVD